MQLKHINKIVSFMLPNFRNYKMAIKKDYLYTSAFHGGSLSKKFLHGYEWRYVKNYRKFQCNQNSVWKYFYKIKLQRLENITGICLEENTSIGDGFIIGHWGNIVVNGCAKLGNQLFLTHGVTIGRDIRGSRAGVPTIGDRVCIRANATIVGNIKIGNDVLIAPNSFVNFDVPDHSIVIGNPASIHHRDDATEGHLPNILF